MLQDSLWSTYFLLYMVVYCCPVSPTWPTHGTELMRPPPLCSFRSTIEKQTAEIWYGSYLHMLLLSELLLFLGIWPHNCILISFLFVHCASAPLLLRTYCLNSLSTFVWPRRWKYLGPFMTKVLFRSTAASSCILVVLCTIHALLMIPAFPLFQMINTDLYSITWYSYKWVIFGTSVSFFSGILWLRGK